MNNEINYKLGIIWLDVQHRRIVEIIKALNSNSHVDYSSIFAQLRFIIEDHFDIEEQFMSERGYDKTESHIEEHNAFVYKIDEVTNLYFIDDDLRSIMLSFLNEWYYNHILEVDNEFAAFLLMHEHSYV